MYLKNKKNNLLTVILLTMAACLIYAISAGIRSNYGIMLGAISENSGISYSAVSFVLAVGQLVFGVMQPVFGIVALKRSNLFVLGCGVALMAVGLLMLPFCRSIWMLLLFLGLVLPSGTGALSFGIIMGAVTPKLTASSASTVSGFVNASSGIGNTVLSPVIQALIASGGLIGAMLFLSVPTLILLPVSLWLCKSKAGQTGAAPLRKAESQPLRTLFSEALRNRTYWFLLVGFFTCGFHMAIIETHLYTQITTYGLSQRMAAYAFSIYGIAAIIGSILSGVICGRVQMRRVLGSLYGARCAIILIFLLVPKNLVTVCIFTALLGLTGSATVPPTSGLVSRTFGAAKLATLFGFVFFSHQIGSFFSAWLGGVSITVTGDYTFIWYTSAALCILASVVSFRIKETKVEISQVG
jgi:predicted MFS family arabinose efflux permease